MEQLKNLSQQSNGPHIYQLCKEVVTANQGKLLIEAYHTRLKTLWENVCDYRPTQEYTCG